MNELIELLNDCLEVLNQIPNRAYWSKLSDKESKTYTLASLIEEKLRKHNN